MILDKTESSNHKYCLIHHKTIMPNLIKVKIFIIKNNKMEVVPMRHEFFLKCVTASSLMRQD